jgi:site-specific DNA-methyltransferase (adenine-specific)
MRPYYEDRASGITIYCGRCEDVLPTLAPVEIVLTDPPYGTGGWRRIGASAGSDPSASLVREEWDDGAVDWLPLVSSCEAVITFWPEGTVSRLLAAATACGFSKHRAVYMRKRDPKPTPGGRMRWSVEPIRVLSGDGFLLEGGDDVYEDSTPRLGRDADATGHPYQKPIEVLRWLVAKTRARTILDPFMGSGTTLRAAKDLGRRAIGIEENEHWCEIAVQRLRQAVLPLGAA